MSTAVYWKQILCLRCRHGFISTYFDDDVIHGCDFLQKKACDVCSDPIKFTRDINLFKADLNKIGKSYRTHEIIKQHNIENDEIDEDFDDYDDEYDYDDDDDDSENL